METLSWGGVITRIFLQLSPVWIALIATFWISISNKRKLGLYGKLFDSTVGMIGFGIVMFWVFAALFSNVFGWLMPNEPQFFEVSMKHALPGEALPDGSGHYLLGGDKQARDVFSRMIYGSGIVIMIAPLATLMAFMVGITLGLPAGYFGGKLDTVLSFLANLILAFPVILLFYLLVTKEIVATGLPQYMAAVLFLFPLIFLTVLFNSRYYTDPGKRNPILIALWVIGGWIYLSFISQNGGDSAISILPAALDAFNPDPNILVVFVSVVFVNSPTVFRIVRGLTLDIKSRDYVAAGQTRGEGPWYIMLWEILPNVRGPLIVDFCLRIGYATILLGTLGFFGLGLETNSPDWGTTINLGRGLLRAYAHPVIVPAFALLSLVLGLNLLADGLREEAMKD
ncbi:ABC transporter permease [Halocynthiibacter sp.]|uniref:ABC transporter permease n=1 Tax=Halocynthiibacter sp. TaxID=1979210 RepID=UPI003C3DC729